MAATQNCRHSFIHQLKHPIRQAHCLHFLLHVHLCVNLRGRDAAMPQYLADRVEFRTCRYCQCCRRMSAAVVGEILFYPSLCLDTPHILSHVVGLLHQREDNAVLSVLRSWRKQGQSQSVERNGDGTLGLVLDNGNHLHTVHVLDVAPP